MIPAVAKILQSALVKDIVKEFEESIQEGAIAEAKKYGIKATSLEDVVKQASNKYVQSRPVETISVKSIDDLVETQKVTNEHLAQILDQLQQSNGLETKRMRVESEERVEQRHRESLVDRMKNVGSGIVRNTSGGVLATLATLVTAVAGYGVMKFFASDFFKTVAEKGIGGYLEEKWDYVKDTVASGFMSMLDSAKEKLKLAGEWMAESFAGLVRFAVDIVDGIKSYIKSQPWVPDFVKDMLGETRAEAASKQQYEQRMTLKRHEEAQSLLESTNRAIEQEKQIIGVRVSAMSQANKWTPEQTKAYADEQMASPRMQELQSQKNKYEKFIEHNAPQSTPPVDAMTQAAPMVSRAKSGGESMLEQIMDREGITDPAVRQRIKGLAQHESSMNPNAKGPLINSGMHKGDRVYGLLQIMPKTAPEVGFTAEQIANDPMVAATAGVRYFMKNLQRGGGDLNYATVAHHSGSGGANRWRRTGSAGTTDVATGQTTDKYLQVVQTKESKFQGVTSNTGDSLIAAQSQQSEKQQEIAQAPTQVQVINTPEKGGGLDSITVALRNDDPSYKKIIEQLALNALGITGSPLANV